jgi:hypothetical protein
MKSKVINPKKKDNTKIRTAVNETEPKSLPRINGTKVFLETINEIANPDCT